MVRAVAVLEDLLAALSFPLLVRAGHSSETTGSVTGASATFRWGSVAFGVTGFGVTGFGCCAAPRAASACLILRLLFVDMIKVPLFCSNSK